MSLDLTTLALADLFSVGGIAAAAAIVFLVTELLKANFPRIDEAVSGATLATVIIAVLYAAAFVSTAGTSLFTTLIYFLLASAGALGISGGLDHIALVRARKQNS